MFDTLSVGSGNRQFTNVQLELSNGVFYPQERMEPHREVARINRTLMRYSRQFNDYLRGPTIDKFLQETLRHFVLDLTKSGRRNESWFNKL